ncbi:hypothetical protein [Thiobacillus denitrificans]|uniref:Terminase small subunit n=1 Tax=Thiobacillus denitrificans TaxID=36861 RepID=A0A106BVR3_THIDE|nr:hypothetical protein [Thiobacillus denitrificans]KVW99501.1 hypothetical protein ABW22_01385 [Thiobacillus denitrificans]
MAHTSVDYQIRKGRIPVVEGKIDAEYADHIFKEKVDAKQSLRGRGQQRLGGGLPTVPAAVAPTLPDDPNDLEAIRRRVPKDYNDAAYLQAVEELLKRRAANAEAEGKLAPAEKVTRAQFELARQVRDSMLAIPSRLQDALAAETDPAQCGRLLAAEIRLALETAAKQAAALTEDMDEALEEADAAG